MFGFHAILFFITFGFHVILHFDAFDFHAILIFLAFGFHAITNIKKIRFIRVVSIILYEQDHKQTPVIQKTFRKHLLKKIVLIVFLRDRKKPQSCLHQK